MNISRILADEIASNSYGLGLQFGAANDMANLAALNGQSLTRNRISMSGSELLENTDATQFAALSDAKKQRWLALCGIDRINPFGAATDIAVDIFGASTVTIIALAAARTYVASPAEELIGRLFVQGDFDNARREKEIV